MGVLRDRVPASRAFEAPRRRPRSAPDTSAPATTRPRSPRRPSTARRDPPARRHSRASGRPPGSTEDGPGSGPATRRRWRFRSLPPIRARRHRPGSHTAGGRELRPGRDSGGSRRPTPHPSARNALTTRSPAIPPGIRAARRRATGPDRARRRRAVATTSAAGRSTNRPTASARPSSARRMAAARSRSTNRAEPGWKLRPTQSTPASTHAMASAGVVSPQTLIFTGRASAGVRIRPRPAWPARP